MTSTKTSPAGSNEVPSAGMALGTARRQAGFTLVEILVVVALIGLVSGVVVMTLPSGASPAVRQSQTLLKALNRAAQTALIDNAPRAFGLSRDAYALYLFTDGQWMELSRDPWQADVSILLKRERREVDIPAALAPVIIFEPTGLSTPFSLSLADDETRLELISRGDGQVVLK